MSSPYGSRRAILGYILIVLGPFNPVLFLALIASRSVPMLILGPIVVCVHMLIVAIMASPKAAEGDPVLTSHFGFQRIAAGIAILISLATTALFVRAMIFGAGRIFANAYNDFGPAIPESAEEIQAWSYCLWVGASVFVWVVGASGYGLIRLLSGKPIGRLKEA